MPFIVCSQGEVRCFMGYIALYRKWRPKTFDDVIGQDHIVKTLKNQITAERLGHAYLFCGTRGTGKTSTAKLFAKAVNCENPIEGEPCNACEACEDANAGQGINVIEIDAASNNSVDNIREIREEVRYTPTKGKYKVYIIDEVHMLSVGAFNALLKTLEEPPSHVIFILATTEPHKILATILSRCQRYDFKRIGIKDIAECIASYMKEEEIVVEDKAINYIASLADGAMRDALSILDQCIAFYLGKEITLEMVLNLLGAVDQTVFYEMTEALNKQDTVKCMELLDQIMIDGRDLSQFLTDLIKHMRNLMVLQTTGGGGNVLDMSEESRDRLLAQAKSIPYHVLIRCIQDLSGLETSLKYANSKRIIMEVGLIKLCRPEVDESIEGLITRLNQLEDKVKKGVKVVQVQGEATPANVKKKPNQQLKKPKAVSDDVKNACKKWSGMRQSITGANKSMLVLLDGMTAETVSGDVLYLVCDSKIKVDTLKTNDGQRLNELKALFEENFDKEFNIKLITREGMDELRGTYSGKVVDGHQVDEEEQEVRRLVESIDFPIDIKE